MVWNLEGASPNIMVRNGWSSQSLKIGDQIKLSIDPLARRAGGAWTGQKTNFSDGRPIVLCSRRILAAVPDSLSPAVSPCEGGAPVVRVPSVQSMRRPN